MDKIENVINRLKSKFMNKNLKKIINVYQQNYINSVGQGIGDFFRGSFFLSFICQTLSLDFDIDLYNHPISKYLKNNNTLYDLNYSNIKAYMCYCNDLNKEINFIDLIIHDMNNCENEIFYLFCNGKIYFDIPNDILTKTRNIILPKIESNEYIDNLVVEKLNSKNLIKNSYGLIHIRCGDYFMNIKKNIDSEKHAISKKHVKDIIVYLKTSLNKNKKYLLIGDSNAIKNIIESKFDNIICFNNNITHLGESKNIAEESIIDTLVDFNFMRFSNFIISFTAYGHGSGFSQYCSDIYGVKFKQILLKPGLSYRCIL